MCDGFHLAREIQRTLSRNALLDVVRLGYPGHFGRISQEKALSPVPGFPILFLIQTAHGLDKI